jgi:hypothetical protein
MAAALDPDEFDSGLRTGACALSQHLRVLYTAKVCTTLSVKVLSITRVCGGLTRHGTANTRLYLAWYQNCI